MFCMAEFTEAAGEFALNQIQVKRCTVVIMHPTLSGGALHDKIKDGCVGDYIPS